MDVLMTAGGIPEPDDPLYKYTQGKPKAYLDIGGKPMIQWVLDAVSGAKSVENINIIGLEGDPNFTCAKPLYYFPSQGEAFENLKFGTGKILEMNPKTKRILFCTSDIPSITTKMVEWAISNSMKTEYDLYFNLVERASMEKRFPGANRTFAKLKDAEVCGCDMNVLTAQVITHNEDLWEQLAGSRKNILRQASLIGFDTLFYFLFRLKNIDGIAKQASKRLGIKATAIISPYAEMAMDVDKPHQYEILLKDLV